MISREFITTLKTKFQTSEQNIAREYCQHIFLSYFYQRNESAKVLFKGGTALRIVFASPRFSEDLDFSAHDLSVENIDEVVDATLVNIGNEGIQYKKQVNPGTQGKTTGGYFTTIHLRLLDFDSEIKLQVSLRGISTLESNSALIQNDFIPPYTITYLTEQSLVGEKIIALLDRAKPRDFFDLYFILRNSRLVKFVPKDVENLKARLEEKVHSFISNDGWANELKVFLPISYHPILKNFESNLLAEIETHIPAT